MDITNEEIMKLKEKIKTKGMKISWIADKIGISQPLLSMYLTGVRKMPKEVENEIKKLLR